MGACDFYTVATGKNAKEAFNRAVEDAQYDSGHGGYTGTIAEKRGFVTINRVADNFKDAINIASELIEKSDDRIDDKWGPVGCIYIGEKDGNKEYLFFGWASS